MPPEMFAGSPGRRSDQPRSRWTLLGSLVMHLLVFVLLIVLPLMAAVDTPIIPRGVIGFVPPTPPPPPPSLRPVRPRQFPPPINPAAAPPSPATALVPEQEIPAATADSIPIGGLPVAPTVLPQVMPGRGVSMLIAPPVRMQPVPVGGQIREPRRLAYVPPVYPTIAQTARVEGMVILEAIIDEAGTVRDVRVLRSIPLLDRAAIDAVSRWRYTPTTLNSVPVPVIMTVTVTFTLR